MITANKIQKFVNSIYSEMSRYFNELLQQYNLSRKWNKLILYNALYSNEDIENIRKNKLYSRDRKSVV